MTAFRLSGATKTSLQEAWRWMFQGFFPLERLHSLSLLVIEGHGGVLWALCGKGIPFIQYVGTTTCEGFPRGAIVCVSQKNYEGRAQLLMSCNVTGLLVAPAATCPGEPGPSKKTHSHIPCDSFAVRHLTHQCKCFHSSLQITQNTTSCDHLNFFCDMWEFRVCFFCLFF